MTRPRRCWPRSSSSNLRRAERWPPQAASTRTCCTARCAWPATRAPSGPSSPTAAAAAQTGPCTPPPARDPAAAGQALLSQQFWAQQQLLLQNAALEFQPPPQQQQQQLFSAQASQQQRDAFALQQQHLARPLAFPAAPHADAPGGFMTASRPDDAFMIPYQAQHPQQQQQQQQQQAPMAPSPIRTSQVFQPGMHGGGLQSPGAMAAARYIMPASPAYPAPRQQPAMAMERYAMPGAEQQQHWLSGRIANLGAGAYGTYKQPLRGRPIEYPTLEEARAAL